MAWAVNGPVMNDGQDSKTRAAAAYMSSLRVFTGWL
jgi:hypothetical protein